jgi:hypothetical protein
VVQGATPGSMGTLNMQQPSEEAFTKLATDLAALLAGHHPHVQGAAIAAMIANWLGAHPPEQREQAFQKLIKTVLASIEDLKALAKEHENASRRSH